MQTQGISQSLLNHSVKIMMQSWLFLTSTAPLLSSYRIALLPSGRVPELWESSKKLLRSGSLQRDTEPFRPSPPSWVVAGIARPEYTGAIHGAIGCSVSLHCPGSCSRQLSPYQLSLTRVWFGPVSAITWVRHSELEVYRSHFVWLWRLLFPVSCPSASCRAGFRAVMQCP